MQLREEQREQSKSSYRLDKDEEDEEKGPDEIIKEIAENPVQK